MPINNHSTKTPFWQKKPMDKLTREEWESLCARCGRCCLNKVEYDDGEIHFTNVACRLLDLQSCACANYSQRKEWVPDCISLTWKTLRFYKYLPKECAYRLLAEGKELPHWHPLISNSPETVHDAGQSIRGKCVSESEAGDLENHIITWESPHIPRRRKSTQRRRQRI